MLEKITSFITGIMVAIGGFFTPTPMQDAPIEPAPIQEESFGAFSPVAGGTYRLKTSIGTSDTTIILSAFTEPITGNPLTMTSLATDIGYATIDPQSSTRKEFVSFTGITQNADGSATLSGVSRGLGFQSPFTASSTLRKSHPGQSIFILSDSPQLFSEYARRRSNETITGQWTFTTFPITPSTTPATVTTSGQVELATGGEAASSTLTGDSGALLALHTGISTSSAPASGNVVVVTGDDGDIDAGFIPALYATVSTTIFSTIGTSTYSKPSGLRQLVVEMCGAGGGGFTANDGGGADAVGTGGGAGGYLKKFFAASAVPDSVSIFVGTGGATDSAGGQTKFGGVATTSGGSAGSETTAQAQGGAGGTATGGNINIVGQDAPAVYGNVFSGAGADSFFGSGGDPITAASTDGNPGVGFCSGGSGARDTSNFIRAGGVGSSGVVIITEFF